ncbi:hypothetical protein ATCC90586_009088 [Pythium insidiosum]|nr:hypothetical protein ATCC90586_009088 [Pythium insidiosum]
MQATQPHELTAKMPQVEPAQPTTSKPMQFVELSRWSFRVAWLGLLALHAICAFYFVVNARIYDKTPGSALDVVFVAYRIGMQMNAYPTLTVVHAIFAAIHIFLGAIMIVWSLWKRRVCFGPQHEFIAADSAKVLSAGTKKKLFPSFTAVAASGPNAQGSQGVLASWRRAFPHLYSSLFSRRGFFGVEGGHFDELLAVREIVEASLQTYQAYRMSQLLARPWLNRFFVSLLVINCWIVPILHFIFRRRNVLLQRVLSLLFDALLDLTAAMAVPSVLLISYFGQFDTATWGFPNDLWADDLWFVNFMTEFQIMLVTSWSDLIGRCVFSIGLLSCIESVKELVRERSSQVPCAHLQAPPDAGSVPTQAANNRRSSTRLRLFTSFKNLRSQSLRRFLQGCQLLCAVLGVVVLVLHLYAESMPRLDQCFVQVEPWLESKPACVFIEWDCSLQQHSGEATAIAAQWSKSTPDFVRRVLILHCPAFEMPTTFTSFQYLAGLKMYNTTIAAWAEDAALTDASHPGMLLTYFVRVNLSNTGELPPGLVTGTFPQGLYDVEFAVSNLHVLPNDLDTKWPTWMFLVCDLCQFTALPPVLSRMAPYWFTFAMNPFTAFPFEVFAIEGLQHFHLGGVPLPSLDPPTASVDAFLEGTALRYIYLPDTNVTWLPRWVDAFAALPRSLWYQPALDLSGTPICNAIEEMQAGTRERFPAEWTAGVAAARISKFMTVTRSNLSALDGVVACMGSPTLMYGLDDDDARYMLP